MGFGNSKKKETKAPTVPTLQEMKTMIQICQKKLTLFRNKKIDQIRRKKNEVIKYLQERNLDYAKAKMENLMRDEDHVTAYDILGPLIEVLLERVIYIDTSSECPPDLRTQLDAIIFASSRLEIEEFLTLKDMIRRKYGQAYIDKAENNVDKQIDENLVAKLQIHLPSEAFVMIRLKQICKEKNIDFDFPNEFGEIPGLGMSVGPGGNPYGENNNPYGQPSDFPFPQENNNNLPPQASVNPYGPQNNNPFGQDSGNSYGPPPDNINPYQSQNKQDPHQSQNNPNPYGPPPDNGNPYQSLNKQDPHQSQNNPNPCGPPPDNGNPYQSLNKQDPHQSQNSQNPYGPPPDNGNPYQSLNKQDPHQSQNSQNPYGPPPDNGNPYQSLNNQNPHQSQNNIDPHQSQNSNPMKESNLNINSILPQDNNQSHNPFNPSQLDNNPFNVSQKNPSVSQNNITNNPMEPSKNVIQDSVESSINDNLKKSDVKSSMKNPFEDNNNVSKSQGNENSVHTGKFYNESQNLNQFHSQYDRKPTSNPFDFKREYTHDEKLDKKNTNINDNFFKSESCIAQNENEGK